MAEQKDDTARFRVVYYAFGGRAEPLRTAAAIGGLCFEDQFITQDEQKKDKAEGKRRWSGPPEIVILDKDGKETGRIAQSNACVRYVAKLAGNGLYPEDPFEAALADELCDSVEDTFAALIGAFRGKETDEEKKAAVKEVIGEGGSVRYWFDKFVNRIDERQKAGIKSGLFVNENITIAELKFAASAKVIMMRVPGSKDGIFAEEKYKCLLKVIETVDGNEKVKAFNEQFQKNCAAFKEKPEVNVFKYSGK